MSEACTHDCGSCSAECGERQQESLLAPENKYSHVRKVIAVVSGKGGVGKSSVTAMLAVLAQRKNKRTAILDGDMTGPSIPKIFGVTGKATGNEEGIFPADTKTGIELMSVNLLLPDDTDPVVWRGPVIAGAVTQFWTDVMWGDVDLMFVDCPPGTGDVPLTVFQSLPVDGIIVVASPQELVSMIVEKAVKMAEQLKIPVLGLVENLSYFVCPNCGEKHAIFGESGLEGIAARYHIPKMARLPIDPQLAKLCDEGRIEEMTVQGLDELLDSLLED